jgi:putative ABC transport system permease protein
MILLLAAAAVALNGALVSAIHSMRWAELPYPEADRLVALRADLRQFGFVMGLSRHLEGVIAASDGPFEAVAGYGSTIERRAANGSALRTVEVSAALTRVLGIEPVLGRGLPEVASEPAVLISHRSWRERFGADPTVIGRSLELDGKAYVIVGVMPAGFDFPYAGTEAWTGWPSAAPDPASAGNVGEIEVIARLAPGQELAAAQAALAGLLAAEPAIAGLREAADLQAAAWPLRRLYAQVDLRALDLLQAAALLLLTMIAANLANLVAAESARRSAEWRLRAALGAPAGRLALSALTFSGAPIIAGAVLGVVLVPAGVALLEAQRLLPANSPLTAGSAGVGWLAALAVTLLMLAVAAVATRIGARRGLSSRAAGSAPARSHGRRVGEGLLVGQMLIATALLGTSVLLFRSIDALLAEDPGFDPSGVAILWVDLTGSLDGAPAGDDALKATLPARHAALREALGAVPGVSRVATAQLVPFSGSEASSTVRVDGGEPSEVRNIGVAGDYFAALGVPLRAGAGFTRGLEPNEGEVIVDTRFLAEFMPTLDDPTAAIGRTVQVAGLRGGSEDAQIVGVVGSVRHRSLSETPAGTLYRPGEPQAPHAWIVVRSAMDPASLLPTLAATVRRLEPGADLRDNLTMGQLLERSVRDQRALARLLAGFALADLVLAAFGLYAVLAYAVRVRRYEWAVRAALGAGLGRLLRHVLRDGARLALIGVPAGVLAGVALARVLGERLHGVMPHDLASWGLASIVMLALVVLASLPPAWRAARTDPALALREA